MKTFYSIVSVAVIILFFWLLGKSGGQSENPASYDTQEITNYVPKVLKDSAASSDLEFEASDDSLNSKNLKTEASMNEITEKNTRMDSLQRIRSKLSGASEQSDHYTRTGRTEATQSENTNQADRTALLLEIKELLKPTNKSSNQ